MQFDMGDAKCVFRAGDVKIVVQDGRYYIINDGLAYSVAPTFEEALREATELSDGKKLILG